MRRRRFLQVGVLAAAVGPAWLRRAFADTSLNAGDGNLERAKQQAWKSGRPLLVIVVPASDEQKWERGRALGEYLNHGSDAQLAPLAFVDVVCAPVAGDPLLALHPPSGEVKTVALGELPKVRFGKGEGDKNEDAIIDKRIAIIADKVRALVPLPPADQRTAVGVSAASVRARLVRPGAPAGSHWATPSACGYPHVEGLVDKEADEKISMDCGMGHVPDKSSRFLYFYTKTPQRRALDQQEKKT
jgi:hypothetical protein